jgi:kynurenine 3-monooxygenase
MAAGGTPKFIVVGAGLGGALMAIYLGRAGYAVEVYERRGDPRRQKRTEGRSINLAISTRGIESLAEAGLAGRVLEEAIPMRGRMIHSPRGALAFQPYGTEESHVINSISRAGLNAILLDAAEQHPGVRIHFGRKCAAVDPEKGSVSLLDVETGETSIAAGDVVVGADGVFSAVRQQMQRLDRFDYQQTYLEQGYKELTLPPEPGGRFALEKNALHIWPRGGFMMIALPNSDGSFTCTLFWPLEGPNSFTALRTEEEIARYFREVFPDAAPLLPSLAAEYLQCPASSLVTIRCRPWYHRDRLVLIGDACHAVVPFYGQGANAAFEDCAVLSDCLLKHAPDREKAFAEYQSLRRRHADALADLSMANFEEMRDRTAARIFLLGKRIEKGLHRLFPAWFVPLYTMVTFTRTPYADAVEKARRQWRVVRAVVAGVGVLVALLLVMFLWR